MVSQLGERGGRLLYLRHHGKLGTSGPQGRLLRQRDP